MVLSTLWDLMCGILIFADFNYIGYSNSYGHLNILKALVRTFCLGKAIMSRKIGYYEVYCLWSFKLVDTKSNKFLGKLFYIYRF